VEGAGKTKRKILFKGRKRVGVIYYQAPVLVGGEEGAETGNRSLTPRT